MHSHKANNLPKKKKKKEGQRRTFLSACFGAFSTVRPARAQSAHAAGHIMGATSRRRVYAHMGMFLLFLSLGKEPDTEVKKINALAFCVKALLF